MGDCHEHTNNLITFDFPVAGSPVSNFQRRFDIRKKTKSLSCMSTSSTSEFVSGHFDGGDGGRFVIDYIRIGSSGRRKASRLAGQLWAGGHGTASNPDKPDGKVYTLTFDPF